MKKSQIKCAKWAMSRIDPTAQIISKCSGFCASFFFMVAFECKKIKFSICCFIFQCHDGMRFYSMSKIKVEFLLFAVQILFAGTLCLKNISKIYDFF